MDKTLILNRLKKAKKITSDTQFAKILGIKTSTLSSWKQRNSIDFEKIFANCEEISIDWLLTGEGNMLKNSNNPPQKAINVAPDDTPTSTNDVKKVTLPLIPIDAIAGVPSGDFTGVTFAMCDQYTIPEFAARGAEFLIRVSGSSMYPKYSNGDILACKRINDIIFFQWGKVYVIDSSQGSLVKRIFEDKTNPDNIICVSDNKENYPPFTLPKSDIRSLSLVIGVIRLE